MAYQFWLDELSLLAKSTRINRILGLKHFLDHEGLDAEGLYRLHRGYVEDGDPRTDRVVPRMVAQYARVMVEEGYAAGTARLMAEAVSSFMEANSLPFPLRGRDLPPDNPKGKQVAPAAMILEWIHLCHGTFEPLRNQALIMVSKDLGFRASDVSKLSVEHMAEAEVREVNGSVFRVFKPYRTQKTGGVAYPHWGPEAEEAVQKYLGGRAEGPLFLDRGGRRLAAGSIIAIFMRLARHTGPSQVSHHSLRKFHRTALEAVMPESYVKKLQGKATDPYIHPEQTGELTAAYLKHYDVLRVYRSEHEYDALKDQLEEEREERGNLERRIRDLELRVRWEELERRKK